MVKILEFPKREKVKTEDEKNQKKEKSVGKKIITTDERVGVHLDKLDLKIQQIRNSIRDLQEQKRIIIDWRDGPMQHDHSEVLSINKRIAEIDEIISGYRSDIEKIAVEQEKNWQYHKEQVGKKELEEQRKRDIEIVENALKSINAQLEYYSKISSLTEDEKLKVRNLEEIKAKLIEDRIQLIKWEE